MEKLRKSTFASILQIMVSLFIISLAILNAPPLTIFSATTVKPTHAMAKNVHLSSSVHQQTNHSWKELTKLEVQNIAQEYMQALPDQQYTVMWSLLHPQIQSKWPNETAFATFLQNRFKEFTLQGFKLGNVQQLSYWVDPETMISYTQLVEIPVSLLLTPRIAPSQNSAIPPEDLHPVQLFQNLPIILQYHSDQDDKGGNWFILDGGPADLEAPILPPMTPTNRIIQVPILMYHHVTPFVSTNRLSDYIRTWVVSPDSFSQQMDYLTTHNYHTITFNQLFDALYYIRGRGPTRATAITTHAGKGTWYYHSAVLLSLR